MRIRSALTLMLLPLFLGAESPPQSKVDEFANKYKNAKSEREKLLLCINMIDEKVIDYGVPRETIDTIFGTNFSKTPLPKKGSDYLVQEEVNFVKVENSRQELDGIPIQAAIKGWYFIFRYGSGGYLVDYSLSNLHK